MSDYKNLSNIMTSIHTEANSLKNTYGGVGTAPKFSSIMLSITMPTSH